MPVMLERWNDHKMDALESKVEDLDSRIAEIGERQTWERLLDG